MKGSFVMSEMGRAVSTIQYILNNNGYQMSKFYAIIVFNQFIVIMLFFKDSTCSLGELDKYYVMFYNAAGNYSVDIIWKNKEGTEQIMASLAPDSHYSAYTYFTHEWIFKSSSSDNLWYAEANGVKSQFYEGCRSKATFNMINFVLITSGNSYKVLLKSLFPHFPAGLQFVFYV